MKTSLKFSKKSPVKMTKREFLSNEGTIIGKKHYVKRRNPLHSWANDKEPLYIFEPVILVSDWDDFIERLEHRCMFAVIEGPHKVACLEPGKTRIQGVWLCKFHSEEKDPRARWAGFIEGA